MAQDFLDRCLSLDLETTPEDTTILEIGAVFRDQVFAWKEGACPLLEALAALERFGDGAELVLGHNLLGHDLPILDEWAPDLALLGKPVVDTLVLSPLAFPKHPYHRLVKDYKLVREVASDPVADARLAAALFADEWRSFAELAAGDPERLALYSFCLGEGDGDGEDEEALGERAGHRARMGRRGLRAVFSAVAGRPPMAAAAARSYLAASLRGRVCGSALEAALAAGLGDPERRSAWAFAAAWLHVDESGSVLPRWVRETYPRVVGLLDALCCRPCDEAACGPCRAAGDLEAQLRRIFELDGFLAQPAAAGGGGSLQRRLVQLGLEATPLLAILPTGGGKSLCYQLPALIRHSRRGLLTVVVSPLQALMQDQVERLNRRTGTDGAAALNGLLTPPERGATLERVRLGEVAILYVAPEQLRNQSFQEAVGQREIGAWVFDEAHCLSKWGHDFRPDYLYAGRFIRNLAEQQRRQAPPVACFTATARADVRREIVEHFRRELGQELTVLGASLRRPELRYEVEAVAPAAKLARIRELLGERLAEGPDGGVALVYFASRAGTEQAARYLATHRLAAAAFHAGVRPPEKRRILDGFVHGELRVICATNAFGMGIDKEDVRLVIHADIPGSLESYFQEAGRAGRDRKPASCVLLFAEEDVERQFRLAAEGRLSRRDIAQILRGLRWLARHRRGGQVRPVVVTSGELLASDEVETSFGAGDHGADTRVKTAISWLERAGLAARQRNQTRVFQGRPRVTSIEAAERLVDALEPPPAPAVRRQWLAIIKAMLNCDRGRSLTSDQLAELPEVGGTAAGEPAAAAAAAASDGFGAAGEAGDGARGDAGDGPGSAADDDRGGLAGAAEPAGIRVLRTLTAMAENGLIDRGLQLSAFVAPRGSKRDFDQLCRLERAMLEALQESAPEAEGGDWCELSLRRLNQRLVQSGWRSHPDVLRRLLRDLAHRERARGGSPGVLELRYRSRHHYHVRLRASWRDLAGAVRRRQQVSGLVLDTLLALLPARAPAPVQVEFGMEDLCAALRRDLVAAAEIDQPPAAAERALLFLHEQQVIQLEQGLAVFRQAMTIQVQTGRNPRQYGEKDFAPLAAHYAERNRQIHVMARYAELAAASAERALGMVDDYFELDRESFLRRHFAGQAATLSRATGRQSFRTIVESLANPAQAALVTAPAGANLLILAGPGAGKTRVVVHRCAYLLRVERVPARGILVVCFNRSACREIARRLRELVGEEARGVIVQTYHGLALLLTGTSLVEAAREAGEEPDFAGLIDAANQLLRAAGGGEGAAGGKDGDAATGDAGQQDAEPGEGAAATPAAPPAPATAGGAEGAGDGAAFEVARGLGAPLRERLLAGFSHILVDEYQDINAAQYELVSNLAGRTREDAERRLAILAVGDDDQTIYGWNGAKVEFIRRFKDDYEADVHHLVENFRSSGHLIAAANRLIEHGRDRMKREAPIRIDAARAGHPAGGRWEALDPAGGGRVRLLRVAGAGMQAAAVAAHLQELRRLDGGLAWRDCAVLARAHGELDPIRALCESLGIPVTWAADRSQLGPLHRVREIAGFLETLAARRAMDASASSLLAGIPAGAETAANPWWSLLVEVLTEWREQTGDAAVPAGETIEFIYGSLAERRREPQRGDGVHLGTVHAAKGLEFPHVVLAGGWTPWSGGVREGGRGPAAAAGGDDEEEARRLFYVGMTRARDTLALVERRDQRHPHLGELRGGDPPLALSAPDLDGLELPPAAVLARRFETFGLRHLFLSYAGERPPQDAIHRRIAALQPGSRLALRPRADSALELIDGAGGPVALLSKVGQERAAACGAVEEVRVLALVERRAAHSAPRYRPGLRCERWYVPLVEVRYRQA